MYRYFFSVLFLALITIASTASLVLAQAGAGITIKPATVEERMEPGTEQTFSVTVRNENNEDQLFYLGTRDIVGVRDGGVPIYSDPELERTEFDMSTWISLTSDTVFIPAQSEVPVSFTVRTPQNASPGSHFAGIFISVEPPEIRESGAAIGYEVANIISIRVAGDVLEKAEIRQFSTDNYIYGSQNVDFNVRIENGGNTLIRPTGPVEVTNMFGTDVTENLIFNESQAGVFPGDTREFTFSWTGEGTGFGRYEAVVSPVYGEEGAKQTMSSSVTFWILPMNIVLPALGVLLTLLLGTYIGVKLYVRRKLSLYAAMGSRKMVRRQQNAGNPLLLIFLVMMTVTALFFMILLVLFS